MKKIFILGVCLGSLISCGGGGGGGGLSQNACDELGLPTKSIKIVNGAACGHLSDSPVVRVAVLNSGGDALGFCSGTAVTAHKVITAAHCFPAGAKNVSILIGDPGAVSNFSGTFKVHPRYTESTSNAPSFAAFFDAAVVTTEKAMPVPTAPLLVSRQTKEGETISIFGYGTDENGNFDFKDLKGGEMAVSGVTVNHISALYTGKGSNTCQGDSGGPAFVDIDGQPALVGVTSTGTSLNCLPPDNSLFTNLAGAVRSFIHENASGAAEL